MVEPNDESPTHRLQVDEVDFHDLARTFRELGEQLEKVGHMVDGKWLPHEGTAYDDDDGAPMGMYQLAEARGEALGAFRRTLTGLRKFRREYHYWERVAVELALTKLGFTQRETADLLGVGLSTVNRWAQHPVVIQDYADPDA